MKKILMIILIAALCFGTIACSNTSQKDTGETKVEEKKADGGIVAEEKEEVEKDKETTDTVEETTADKEEEKEEDEEIAVLEVDGLSGLELLQSIRVNLPETVISTTDSIAADGTTSTSTLYTKGDNMRTETDTVEMGEQVMIYNAELGEMYVYSVEEMTGIISTDSEDMEGLDFDDDTEMDGDLSYAELMEGEDLSNFEAKVEELNGEKVIYIHTSGEEEGMAMDIHMWYSMDYMVAMKTEMYINGTLAGSSEVTDIQVNVDIDDSMFEKPEDVIFMDLPF